jgi:hypothetical protein
MKGISIMSRMKAIFAGLLLTAIVCVMPQAQAQSVKVMLAGSSAMWQTMALGAYNSGHAILPDPTTNTTCHYTGSANFNLTDNRPAPPAPAVVDSNAIWIVWSVAPPNTCATGPAVSVWAYIKVDSVVGNRCYFAAPKCVVNVASFPAPGNAIPTALWGDGTSDVVPTSDVQALFTAPATVTVTAAATDIRPEDAAFAECRVNSPLGASAQGGGLSDGLDGLGYSQAGATQHSGVCPAFITGNATQSTTNGVGNPIKSGYPGSTSVANVLAFNLSGKDPITGNTLPAAYTTYAVGAAPIVFVFERDKGQLGSLQDASELQLQSAFSGTNCDASAFGLPAGGISINLREPLSGTENTTESTVFRRPTIYPTAPGVIGVSQEANVGANNPLKANPGTCLAGGGNRYRGIGTGEEVKSVLNSGVNYGTDGIGYTFFSYGNVSSIANNPNYGYLTLNGVDPIFQAYGTTYDPGQPTVSGELPKANNLPATCAGGLGAFPCAENIIWTNGFSFPNLRNGTYRSWSLLRLVSTGTSGTNADDLLKASNKYVVTTVPDYVSFTAVTVGTLKDLGLKVLRSHYQQKDGAGTLLGKAPVNEPTEAGGDMGGQIIPTTIGATTETVKSLIQDATATSLGPVARP